MKSMAIDLYDILKLVIRYRLAVRIVCSWLLVHVQSSGILHSKIEWSLRGMKCSNSNITPQYLWKKYDIRLIGNL